MGIKGRKAEDFAGKSFSNWTVSYRDLEKNASQAFWKCRCVCGTESSISAAALKSGRSRSCRKCAVVTKRKRQAENLVGKVFGKWTVLHRYIGKLTNIYWVCKCECGLTKPVNGSHLRLGKSVSCRKCCERGFNKKKICSKIWYKVKRGASPRGILVDLGEELEAKEFLYNLLYEKQKCVCALSGLSIGIANTIDGDRHGETTASLDRIDSSKGYTKDNVQWVHKWLNMMKCNLSEKQFIELCGAVVRYKKN